MPISLEQAHNCYKPSRMNNYHSVGDSILYSYPQTRPRKGLHSTDNNTKGISISTAVYVLRRTFEVITDKTGRCYVAGKAGWWNLVLLELSNMPYVDYCTRK
jgi:hypothetical protein